MQIKMWMLSGGKMDRINSADKMWRTRSSGESNQEVESYLEQNFQHWSCPPADGLLPNAGEDLSKMVFH